MNDIINADSTNQTGTQTIKEATMQQPTFQSFMSTQPLFDMSAAINAAIFAGVSAATAPLLERIELLERSLVVADKAAQGNEADLSSRIAALEARLETITTASDERIREIAEEVAEAVIYEHNDEYDHDEYDRFDDRVEEKVSEAINDYDFEDKVKYVLRGANVSIDI